jgi:hypothetical protein
VIETLEKLAPVGLFAREQLHVKNGERLAALGPRGSTK